MSRNIQYFCLNIRRVDRKRGSRWILGIQGLLLIASLLSACDVRQKKTLTISIAASLTNVMEDIRVQYQAHNPHIDIDYNIASSGTLQYQIEQGAPVDVFISADAERASALAAQHHVLSQQVLLENQMALVVPRKGQKMASFQDLQRPQVARIALGHPDSVPAGKYSQEILTRLRLYPALKSKLIFAKDVRQVLFYVETGNVDAGFVYLTDAQRSETVRVVATAPSTLHSSIQYPVVVLKRSRYPQVAQSFVAFLQRPVARNIFKAHGFQIPALRP